MSKKYIITVCNNSFSFYNINDNSYKIIKFTNTLIPYTPFYHYLFEENFDQEIINYLFECNIDTIKGKLFNNYQAVILYPDDTLEIDRKILSDYFFMRGFKKIVICSQSLLLSKEEIDYISISQTVRAFIISCIKNGNIETKQYFDVNKFNISEFENIVKNLCFNNGIKCDNIFVNKIDENIIPNDLGKIITLENLNKNCKELLHKIIKVNKKSNFLSI